MKPERVDRHTPTGRLEQIDERLRELRDRRRELNGSPVGGETADARLRRSAEQVRQAAMHAARAAEAAIAAYDRAGAVHERAAALHDHLADTWARDHAWHRDRAREHRDLAENDHAAADRIRADGGRRRT